MPASENDVTGWVEAVANLHDSITDEPDDAQAASEAAAILWSGYGYQNAPTEVQRMIVRAIEIGYMTALRNVRAGDFDRQIRW